MAIELGVYKCEVCGNIVEVVHAGDGELVCCGKPMKRMVENTVDADKEKHVPVIERNEKGILVKVGAKPHPMEDKHHIEWIELIAGGMSYHAFLRPGNKAEVFFEVTSPDVVARAYCNLHGLWAAKA